ncbi:MAG: GNAT family N-acetyltransferase [Marmoricola sp.]
MVKVPTLTDARGPHPVSLRGHREDDVPGCLEQCTDPLSIAWTTVPVPYTRDDAKRFVRHAMPGGWETDAEWGFALEYDGRYGGTVSLRNEGEGRAEIAYGSHPGVRGTGAVERALRLLLEWGFEERRLHTVIWLANVGNWASRKVAWRLGFDIAPGVVRQWLPHRGELRDAWVGTLLATDERSPRHPWLDVPVIELPGLRLRPLRPGDDPRVIEACTDEVSRHWLGQLPSPYQASDAAWWREDCLRRASVGEAVTWAMADPDDDRIIGAVNLFGMGGRLREAEVGYWVHPETRGRGIGTAATRAAVRHGLLPVAEGGLGLDRVEAIAAVGNTASRRVLERAGMRPCGGVERSAVRVRDGLVDAARYDVLPSELSGD